MTTIGFNIFVFIGEYIFSIFGSHIVLTLFNASGTNTERGEYILNLVGEKVDYYGAVYGSFIKIPLIFLVALNILMLLVFRKTLFKLYKHSK